MIEVLFTLGLAFLLGIPYGLIFPARSAYLFVDFIGGCIFFISMIIFRFVEGRTPIHILLIGLAYGMFLLGAAFTAKRWNSTVAEKERIVNALQKSKKE